MEPTVKKKHFMYCVSIISKKKSVAPDGNASRFFFIQFPIAFVPIVLQSFRKIDIIKIDGFLENGIHILSAILSIFDRKK